MACLHPKKEKSIDERLTLIRTYDLLSPVDRVVLIWHKMMITEICRRLSEKAEPDEKFKTYFHLGKIESREG